MPRHEIIFDQTTILDTTAAPAGTTIQPDRDHGRKPWRTAVAANVVLTTPTAGWQQAPVDKPEGWPGAIRHFHTVSAGLDAFPEWVFDVPNVTCGRGTTSPAIGEYVLSVMLEAEKRLAQTWLGTQPARAAIDYPAGGLQRRTLAVVGFGSVAQAIIQRAQAFEMDIRVLRKSAATPKAGVMFVNDLKQLLYGAHYAVLALPLTPDSRHFAGKDFFAAASDNLHLINISRGGTLDQGALKAFLQSAEQAMATLDVTEPEPLPEGHWMWTHPRVRITPHISWKDHRFADRARAIFFENFAAVQADRVPPGRI